MSYYHKYKKYKDKYKKLLETNFPFIDTNYLPSFKSGEKDVSSMILPHAGSKFIKTIMDYCFDNIPKYNKIIILSTNHTTQDNYQPNIIYPNIQTIPDIPIKTTIEHSYQSVLPYLKILGAQIIIIIIGKYDQIISDIISKHIDSDTLIIANTDLLHCGKSYNHTCPTDIIDYNNNTITKLIQKETNYDNHMMCGREAILTFFSLTKNNYYTDHVYTSSDRIGTEDSVGYVGMMFNKTGIPDLANNRYLIDLPKNMIESWILDTRKFRKNNTNMIYVKDVTGIFVTIEKNNQLRGCIGTWNLHGDLMDTILDTTISSALHDSRFNPLTQQEIQQNKMKYKINFLKKSFIVTKDDIINTMKVGLHGITVYFEMGSATYLASVMPEHFGVTQDNLGEKIDMIIESLRRKTGGIGHIRKIELYECIEVY